MKIKRSILALAVIPSILMSGCGEMTSDISEMIGSAADNVAASVSNNIDAVYVGSNENISKISKVLIENNTDRSMLDSRIISNLYSQSTKRIPKSSDNFAFALSCSADMTFGIPAGYKKIDYRDILDN